MSVIGIIVVSMNKIPVIATNGAAGREVGRGSGGGGRDRGWFVVMAMLPVLVDITVFINALQVAREEKEISVPREGLEPREAFPAPISQGRQDGRPRASRRPGTPFVSRLGR